LAARYVLPALAPEAPLEALLRLRKTKRLRSTLHRRCSGEHGVRAPLLAFDRWLCRAALRRGTARACGDMEDPLLPSDAAWLDHGLVRDLERGGVPTAGASELAVWLASSAAAAASTLKSAATAGAEGSGLVQARFDGNFVDLQLPGLKPYLRITRGHYEKLLRLHRRTLRIARRAGADEGRPEDADATQASAAVDDADESFLARAWCVVARYEVLGGAGYQAAVGGDGFEVLRERMGVRFECFASPLNCRYSRYCSAFEDTDAAFGSLGSFFNFWPRKGSFEANPPFVPELMSKMVEHMEELLAAGAGPLSFVIVIPAWREVRAWDQLHQSGCHRGTFVLPAERHGFVDGAQHQRSERYRPSSYDTAVICLQNDGGAERWPFDAATLEAALGEAMRARGGAAVSIAEYEARIRGTPGPKPRRGQSIGGADEGGAEHVEEPPAKKPCVAGSAPRAVNATAVEKQLLNHPCRGCGEDLPAAAFSRKMLTRPPARRRCAECVARGRLGVSDREESARVAASGH